MTRSMRYWACLSAAWSLAASPVAAGTIVPDLNDGDALATFSTADTDDDVDSGPLDGGLTLAVRVTPNADDLANSATGPVPLLEIGGTTSGSGLMLFEGSYWFSTSSGNSGASPSSAADLDGSDGAIGVAIGPAVADQTVDLYATFDRVGGSLLTSLDGAVSRHALTGVGGWNWRGNGTLTFAGNNDTDTGSGSVIYGWRGGLTDNGASEFFTNNALDFTGDAALGQYFNGLSTVPEPAAALLLAIGGLGLARRRG